MHRKSIADEERSVAAIYEDEAIAGSYLEKRLQFSWQRLLHRKQVEAVNRVVAAARPASVLEVAPGPARLAAELRGVTRGVMIENSEEMIAIAHNRLRHKGLDQVWTVKSGNAFELDRALPEGGFELAFTFRFLRHFRSKERDQLYGHLRDRMAVGGLLMFDVVNAVVRERIDAKLGDVPEGEIAIYDVTYTPQTLRTEMQSHGFEVVALTPVVRHFALQSLLSYKLDDVVPRSAELAVRLLEKLPGSAPLEWVACCRKR
jgi:hypothetical protein